MLEDRLNIASIEASLQKHRPEDSVRLSWLDDSHRFPQPFWQMLKHTNDAFFAIPAKSTPFKSYDFYHDIVFRNQNTTSPAFCWYDPVAGWKQFSYTGLGDRASRKAAAWQQLGLAPGDILCIVLPFGPEFAVSLLAALKLGLCISVLPPVGKRFLDRRIACLSPDVIETDPLYQPLLTSWKDKILLQGAASDRSSTDSSETSHVYPGGSVLGYCFDPASAECHMPVELPCDAIYLNPMRDGMLALGLRPGRSIAAPGFDFLETQPALLLTGLLNGATVVHLDPNTIKTQPECLSQRAIDCFGIDKIIRDMLIQDPPPRRPQWPLIFRNPAQGTEPDRWQLLVDALDLKDSRFMNLKWDPGNGGCSLFSTQLKAHFHPHVLPSAAVQWSLSDAAADDLDRNDQFGALCLQLPGAADKDHRPTAPLLIKDRYEWIYAGSRVSGRYGRHYPVDEVLEAVEALQLAAGCSIAALPDMRHPGNSTYTLLIFTGGQMDTAEAEMTTQIKEGLKGLLGEAFLPDRMVFLPLFPRRLEDGAIDHAWCREQWAAGFLVKKTRDPLFQSITRIRHCLTMG